MGLLKSHFQIICLEQSQCPIPRVFGNVASLGQQAIYMSLDQVRDVIQSHGLKPNPNAPTHAGKCKIPSWEGTPYAHHPNIEDTLITLGASSVSVLDVSAYEHPDHIVNLNDPLPQNLVERFDTVFDIGTLEHIFDTPTALKNIDLMLRPGGSVVIGVPTSNAIDHGFYSFSPTLFFDYFSMLGYQALACYLKEQSPFLYEQKGRVFRYKQVAGEIPLYSPKGVDLLFFAQKPNSPVPLSSPAKPIQSIYAQSEYWKSLPQNNPLPTTSTAPKIALKTLFKWLWTQTMNVRPWFIDSWFYRRKMGQNLEYVGRY